jgi:acetyltransferase-like isoleucine patch superfamily enzyme
VQGKFKLLGDARNIFIGKEVSFTREPWPFFDVKGGGIYFGDNVVISSGVHIFTHDHQFHNRNWRELDEITPTDPTVIMNDVFLGVNALIMPTCKYIGKCSVIGAGAVITKDVPDYEIWAGNPAVKIGDVK